MVYSFNIIGDYNNQPAVYKMIFGSKYYIWKCLEIKHSVETMGRDINRYLNKGITKDHALVNVVSYIKANRIIASTVVVLFQTTDPQELIDFEKAQLDAAKNDPACLNIIFEPYITKWLKEKLGLTEPEPIKFIDPIPKLVKKAVSENKETVFDKYIGRTVNKKDTTALNKPVGGNEIPTVEQIPVIVHNIPVQAKETISEKAKRISEAMAKIKSKKRE